MKFEYCLVFEIWNLDLKLKASRHTKAKSLISFEKVSLLTYLPSLLIYCCMPRLFFKIRRIDWLMTAAILFLVLLGLIVIYGISLNRPEDSFFLFKKQLAVAVIGIAAYFAFSTVNYRIWQTFSKLIYWVFFAGLIGVLLFGSTIRGTTGWIQIGGIGLQPVEFAKIAVLIFLAKYFSDYAREFFLWRHIIVSGLSVMLIVGLILLQPDLGSAMVMVATWFLMLIIVRIKRTHLLTLILIFIATALIAWFFVLQTYQKDRIYTFINPQADPLGAGYNVSQSIIAVGSGRIWGRGFALGSQSQLHFLPEPETDFIFAVLSEEFGLIGVVILLGGYLIIIYRIIKVSLRTRDNFAAYFSLGLSSMILVQSFINIGMNMGIAPVTGIPLPLISAGGSSMIAILGALGIVNNIVSSEKAG